MLQSCATTAKKSLQKDTDLAINLNHFQHLYKEVELDGKKAAIVHIYSEYPDYHYAIEPSEGFSCVDDVARAIIMLSAYHKTDTATKETLQQLKKMLEFVLFMQNKNGYFNNFIWNDLSINTTYKTSVAELNWWSLRALWALETAYPIVEKDKMLASRIHRATERLIKNIQRDLPVNDGKMDTSEGMDNPTWLPQKYAGDQAAILLLGLLANYQRTHEESLKEEIHALAEGIMLMQRGSVEAYPYGAFMSWENLWHAWGNNQAYALLKTGQFFNNQTYIDSALKEIDHFYPYLLKNGFAEAFWIKQENGQYQEIKRNEFPQIAYGIRPMVWATLEAWKITKKGKYDNLAKELSAWLLGQNIAKTRMYDASTGRCHDGIISTTAVNKNAGAESTIECLLTLIKIQEGGM